MSTRGAYRFAFVALASLAAVLSAGTAKADPGSTTHIAIPFAFTADDPCTGEAVAFEGELREVVTSHLDSAGGVHHAEAARLRLSGVGLVSGTVYRYIQTSPDSLNLDTSDGFPFEATAVTTGHTIGAGSTDDFLVHTLFHETIDANGDVTSEVLAVTTECVG
jgi:hypothetical protein